MYNKPNQVKFNSKRYQANYWTQGNNPELTNGQYNYWLDLGACNGSGTSSVAPPNYVDGSTYATGALVKNAGSEYRCTVGGWCTVGGPYAPGTGWAWTNAWALMRSCQ